MDSASDFGSGGCGFESRLGLFLFLKTEHSRIIFWCVKKLAVRGDRTPDLLLTKQLPCRLAITALCGGAPETTDTHERSNDIRLGDWSSGMILA